jgi:hypothetical protein
MCLPVLWGCPPAAFRSGGASSNVSPDYDVASPGWPTLAGCLFLQGWDVPLFFLRTCGLWLLFKSRFNLSNEPLSESFQRCIPIVPPTCQTSPVRGADTIVRTQYYKVLLTCDYGLAILCHASRKTHLRPDLSASPRSQTFAVKASSLRHPITSLFRSFAKTRSFLFNTLHTLFNSSVDISPAFAMYCALFAKNTRGRGHYFRPKSTVPRNSNRCYIFRKTPLQPL